MALNGRLAVIGIGSPIMTDDSIGLRISENIQKMNMEDVDCFQAAVGGLELLPLLRGYSYAVIVDAIQTWNYDPGTILIFDVADFESTVHDVPSHDINVATAIKIGREMDPGLKMVMPHGSFFFSAMCVWPCARTVPMPTGGSAYSFQRCPWVRKKRSPSASSSA